MKKIALSLVIVSTLAMAGGLTLKSNTLDGQLTTAQEFNGFGCSGANISPELQWSKAPQGTKSYAITVYDKDAPTGSGWWHWVVVNIPLSIHKIKEGASGSKKLPQGALETTTNFGQPGFGGACPPKGDSAHAYAFTIHALDIEKLPVESKSNPALVGYMINQHTLQKATITSYYKR